MPRNHRIRTPCIVIATLWLTALLTTQCMAYMPLEQALLNDMIPPSSRLCQQDSQNSSASFFFNFTFTPSSASSPSMWNTHPNSTVDEEPLLFLVEMRHEDPKNENRSWTIRLGKGGQVYSWRSSFGEALPPQYYHSEAAWIDTVLQMVSVNQQRNVPPEHLYYIHQAGTYRKDVLLKDEPFYAPTLAVHCHAQHQYCDVLSWGQQAHIPSVHRSDVLYYVRYRHCGDGVLEVTQMVHNAAYKDQEDVLTYLNVPWTGLRHSTFHSVLLSSNDANRTVQNEFPVPIFGQLAPGEIVNLRDTGGFTTFAQQVPATMMKKNATVPLPCIHANGTHAVDCNNDDALPMNLVVRGANPCFHVAGLSSRFGYDVLRMELLNYGTFVPTLPGCRKWCGVTTEGLVFQNERTKFAIQVKDVMLWLRNGRYLYASSNVTAADINRDWQMGDEIQVLFASALMNDDDNNNSSALTFVHGVDKESSNPNNTWITRPGRMRHGAVLAVERDLLIYTVNFMGNVRPGDTYVNRYFVMNGELQAAQDRASVWVEETFQDMLSYQDHHYNAQNLTLFATNTSLTVLVGSNATCLHHHEAAPQCRGSSTPTRGSSPLFYITCGNVTYVGSDQYYFAPPRQNHTEPLRPYLCHNDGQEQRRPSWKLLGYFPDSSSSSDCVIPADLEYVADLCGIPGP